MRRDEWISVVLALGVGALGLLPGPAGALDPHVLLAWLALVAPALGILAGVRAGRLWPVALFTPALWSFLLLQAHFASARQLGQPVWGAAVVSGFFLVGLGIGRLARARADGGGFALAGAALFATLVLTGLSVQGGLGRGSSEWVRRSPELARAFVELSPLVVAFESAGIDWTHLQPDVYVRSGVEWFPRAPYRGFLAASVVLLVGSSLAVFASRRGA